MSNTNLSDSVWKPKIGARQEFKASHAAYHQRFQQDGKVGNETHKLVHLFNRARRMQGSNCRQFIQVAGQTGLTRPSNATISSQTGHVHESLERRRRIAEPQGHHTKLKESCMSNKRSLLASIWGTWPPASIHWLSPSWKTTVGDPADAMNHLYGAAGMHPSL